MFQKNVGCRITLSLRCSYILTLIFTCSWGSCDVTLVYLWAANYLPTCHCCKWTLEAHDVLNMHTFQLNSPLEIRLPWPILCNAHIICSYSHNPITFIENLPFQNIPCICFRLLVLHYLIFNFLHKVKLHPSNAKAIWQVAVQQATIDCVLFHISLLFVYGVHWEATQMHVEE